MRDEIPYLAFLGAVTVAAVAMALLSLLSGCTTVVCTHTHLRDSPVSVETEDRADVETGEITTDLVVED